MTKRTARAKLQEVALDQATYIQVSAKIPDSSAKERALTIHPPADEVNLIGAARIQQRILELPLRFIAAANAANEYMAQLLSVSRLLSTVEWDEPRPIIGTKDRNDELLTLRRDYMSALKVRESSKGKDGAVDIEKPRWPSDDNYRQYHGGLVKPGAPPTPPGNRRFPLILDAQGRFATQVTALEYLRRPEAPMEDEE